MSSIAVLVWGATGMNGSRVCRELAKRYQATLSNLVSPDDINNRVKCLGEWLDGISPRWKH